MAAPLIVVLAVAGPPKLLRRTLLSLAACDKPASYAGTIVVENGPQCGTEAIVASLPRELRAEYRHVPVANKSHALNVVLASLSKELIFFTDDDVRFDPQILTVYAREARGATGGEFYGGPLPADFETEPPPDWLKPYLPYTAQGWKLPYNQRTLVTEQFFLGPNWAAFAADLKAIGGYETRMGPGAKTGSTGQETDAERRLLKAGVKAYYLPDAVAWHYVLARCRTPEWAIERAYRHGVEWGIRRGRDLRYSRLREEFFRLRVVRGRCVCSLLRMLGGEQQKFHADYVASRWRGRLHGIRVARAWDQIPTPELPAEFRRAA